MKTKRIEGENAPQGNKKPRLNENDSIGQQMWRLYKSGKHVDVTIKCSDAVWKVHKGVISAQSRVFAAMLEGEFRESKTGAIKLSDDVPALVENMIQFFYAGVYGFHLTVDEIPKAVLQHSGDIWVERSLACHAKMCILADKYDIPTSAKQLVSATKIASKTNPRMKRK